MKALDSNTVIVGHHDGTASLTVNWKWNVHDLLSSCPVVAMEPFTYKLFPTFFTLLDDMSMLFSQIESETTQIESGLRR